MNDGVDSQLCSLSYTSLNEAVVRIRRLRKATKLAKLAKFDIGQRVPSENISMMKNRLITVLYKKTIFHDFEVDCNPKSLSCE